MIIYEKHPISAAEASKLKEWLTCKEAQLFRDCLESFKNSFLIDSLNIKCRPSDTDEQKIKNNTLSKDSERRGLDVQWLINQIEEISDPKVGFFRIKIIT